MSFLKQEHLTIISVICLIFSIDSIKSTLLKSIRTNKDINFNSNLNLFEIQSKGNFSQSNLNFTIDSLIGSQSQSVKFRISLNSDLSIVNCYIKDRLLDESSQNVYFPYFSLSNSLISCNSNDGLRKSIEYSNICLDHILQAEVFTQKGGFYIKDYVFLSDYPFFSYMSFVCVSQYENDYHVGFLSLYSLIENMVYIKDMSNYDKDSLHRTVSLQIVNSNHENQIENDFFLDFNIGDTTEEVLENDNENHQLEYSKNMTNGCFYLKNISFLNVNQTKNDYFLSTDLFSYIENESIKKIVDYIHNYIVRNISIFSHFNKKDDEKNGNSTEKSLFQIKDKVFYCLSKEFTSSEVNFSLKVLPFIDILYMNRSVYQASPYEYLFIIKSDEDDEKYNLCLLFLENYENDILKVSNIVVYYIKLYQMICLYIYILINIINYYI